MCQQPVVDEQSSQQFIPERSGAPRRTAPDLEMGVKHFLMGLRSLNGL
jgi:hypothetical protein